MAKLSLVLTGTLKPVLEVLERAGSRRLVAMAAAQAINHTAKKALTQVKRSLVRQTGLPYATVSKDLKLYSASPVGNPIAAKIVGKGRFHKLLEFHARQLGSGQFGHRKRSTHGAGVIADPWATRRLFTSQFGVFIVPGRNVYRRTERARNKIKPMWGPNPGRELGKGPTLAVFERTVATELKPRYLYDLRRITGFEGT